MLVERSSYPSPLARLALLAEITDAYLPGKGSKMLDDLGLKPKAIAANHPEARDLVFVEEVAKTVVQPLPDNLGKLEDLLAFRKEEFEAKGEVEKRSAGLLAKKPGEVNKDLRRARLIAASTSRAWSEIMKMTDQVARQAAIEDLPRALKDIIACAPPGKRAAPVRAAAGQHPGDELAKALDEIVDSEAADEPNAEA